MPVTSSIASFDGPVQRDGTRWIREVHSTLGQDVELLWLGNPGVDLQAVASARSAIINSQLAEAEATDNLSRDEAPVLVEMTASQLAARVRERYRAADRDEACRLAYWLTQRITAGQITDAQCRTAFGVTNTQWTNFKANKLTPQANAWAAVLAATGG